MPSKKIDFNNINFYNNLISDYLNKSSNVKEFVVDYFTEKSIKNSVDNRAKFKIDRALLVTTLKAQYEPSNIDSSLLDELKKESTFTVTTGHQLNYFGGPLYLIYKILAVINYCEKLNNLHNDKMFLPTFWMATEDHDFDEINCVNVFGNNLKWHTNQNGAVGRFIIDQEFINLIAELELAISSKPFGGDLIQKIKSAYTLNETLASATRKFIFSVIPPNKLIIVDGDDVNFKKAFEPYILKELNEGLTYKNVTETNKKLLKKGYHNQVFVRENNLFYLNNNDRERILNLKKGEYELFNSKTKLFDSDIFQCIEKISPNALLRPLFQEIILPNIAYVGGAGEMSYWLQLKENFSDFKVNYPAIIIRNSFINVDRPFLNKLDKYNLTIEDIFKDIEALRKAYVVENSKEELSLNQDFKSLIEFYENLKSHVSKVDKSLIGRVEGEQKKSEKFILELEKRLIKQQKTKFENDLIQIEKLKNKIFPNNNFQEREESFVNMYAIYGSDWIRKISEEVNVFDNSIKVIVNE